jgi:PST family polysaccharide transporter
LSGIAALFILRYSFGIKLRLPSIALIKRICRDSWEIFLSQLSATLLTSSNTFILGLFASKESVGIFTAADKVVRLVVALTVPVNNAVYPRVCQMFQESQEKSMIFLRRIFINGTMLFASASIALYLGANQIVRLAIGANDSEITLLVKLMAAIPLLIFVYNFYGNNILLNLSMRREFASALFFAGIFSVLSSLAFVPVFQEKATASIFLFSELLVMTLMLRTAHRKGFNLFKPKEPLFT